MKVLLVSQFFYPESGASQIRLLEMSKYLTTVGHDVEVITALPNYPKGKVYEGFKKKIFANSYIEKIKINHLFIFPSSSKNIIIRFFASLSFSVSLVLFSAFKKEKKYDIVISETPPLNIAYLTYFLNRFFYKSSFILNVSDSWPLALFDLNILKSDSFIGKLLIKIEKQLYKSSAGCIGQSEEIINRIKEVNPNSKILTYSNSVNSKDFIEFPKNYEPTNKDKPYRLVYAGLLGLAQEVSKYIENIPFEELGYELHIYGEGPDVENINNKLKSHKGVFYHGYSNYETIASNLGSFDFSFIPMIQYVRGTVPAKTYESMAAGLPIIMAASGEASRLITTNKIGWVSSPSDYESLIENLKQIKNVDRDELLEMSRRCRKLAVETYDRSYQNEKLGAFISSLKNDH